MAYKGISHVNQATPILSLYHYRKLMSKLGITSDVNDLQYWELDAYAIIEDEIAKQEKLERKKLNGSKCRH